MDLGRECYFDFRGDLSHFLHLAECSIAKGKIRLLVSSLGEVAAGYFS